jgi:hypothetical protein
VAIKEFHFICFNDSGMTNCSEKRDFFLLRRR